MSSALHVAVSAESGKVPVSVLILKGNLDASTQQVLESKAYELIDGGAKELLLDMSELTYIGSAGLRAMLSISAKLNQGLPASKKFAHLKLLKPSAEVHKVLKTLGFEYEMDIFDDLDQAVASF